MSFKVHCSVNKDEGCHVIRFNELEDSFIPNFDLEDICDKTILFLRNKFKKEIDLNILDFYSCADDMIEFFIKNETQEKSLFIRIIMTLKRHPEIDFLFS